MKANTKTKRGKATILRAAARLIDNNPKAWGRGLFGSHLPPPPGDVFAVFNNQGKFCVLGAVGQVEHGFVSYPSFCQGPGTSFSVKGGIANACKAACLKLFGRESSQPHWVNDTLCKNAKDASRFLRAMARALDHGDKL